MELYEGQYEHQKTENLDEFLKEIGIPYVFRKMMCMSNPSVEVKRLDDDKWSIVMKTFKNIAYTFKTGESVESTGFSGTCKNIFTFDGPSIKQTQTNEKYTIEVTREFSEKGMIMKMLHKDSGITATRSFRRT